MAFILSVPIQSGLYRKVGTLGQEQGDASHPALLALSPKSFVLISPPPPTPLPVHTDLAHLSLVFEGVIMGPQQGCGEINGQLG